MDTEGPFPGGKARPGRDADHSLPSSAEVVNEWELYFLSPKRLHGLWRDCFTFVLLRTALAESQIALVDIYPAVEFP
jgi:hypothetical protein